MTTTEKIEIEPYLIDSSINYVKMFIDDFRLNAIDCWVSCYQYDKNDKMIQMSRVYIPPEIYKDWATDDDYLIEYCMEQLGFIRKPELKVRFPE